MTKVARKIKGTNKVDFGKETEKKRIGKHKTRLSGRRENKETKEKRIEKKSTENK